LHPRKCADLIVDFTPHRREQMQLVRFHILDRRVFRVTEYLVSKEIRYVGDLFFPEPNETERKDRVRATPGAVTRIIVRFEGY
jgi:spore coat protein A